MQEKVFGLDFGIGGAEMNGGYIPLCPQMFKGDKGSMGVRPLPCVRDEHGAINEQTVKQLFLKINVTCNRSSF